MKIIYTLLVAILLLISCNKQEDTVRKAINASETVEIQKTPTATLLHEVLDLPACESAVYDATHNRIYASVIGAREPGDGGVAIISLDGKLLNKDFIAGLNDPKGIAITEDRLYVSDVTELVEADRATGEILKKHTAEGIAFLNDVAIAPDGTVYVSDTRTSEIYALDTAGNFSLWLADAGLDNPNGLLVQGNTMYVASWGSDPAGGRVSQIAMDTKKISVVTPEIVGNLDGIRPYDENRLIISDWQSGNIHLMGMDGSLEKLLQVGQSVGDIAYLPEKKILLLPMNKQARLLMYEVK